ncbi:MAG: class I SAM-dependent methyltransferase [Bacteroidota bacterium]
MSTQQLPQKINGIDCYAPELAYANENYSADIFERLYKAEDENFWFRSRNRLIRHFVRKYQAKKDISLLEVGCGTGYVLKGLSGLPGIKLSGSEIFLEGLKFTQMRLPDIELVQLDATKMPFREKFDIVGAFDVLEHIGEDEQVMKQVNQSLKPGGYFLISVPQHRFMWSYLDDMACHKRRYTRKEIRGKLRSAGFKTGFITSFVFTLFPLMWVSRLFKRKKKNSYTTDDQMKELELPKIINLFFGLFMRIDELLIKAGLSLPFGGSLIVVAQKN